MKAGLGIESTAHTFGVGVVSLDGRILSEVRSVYRPASGGIHPREASRHHVSVAVRVLREAIKEAGVGLSDLAFIAVALGPGMGPCLRVGATVARTLALRLNLPLVPVNHGVAHIEIARYMTGTKDPLVVFVSGGSTMIVAYSGGRYRIFGETLDLPLGNLLDSFGEELGFPHPGLVKVEEMARRGKRLVRLPYTVKGQDVVYSGLYSAALRAYRGGTALEDVCLSIVEYAYCMLGEVVERALAFTGKKELVLTGGVARSKRLQEIMRAVASEHGAVFKVVPERYAGDNGAMIALTGLLAYRSGVVVPVEKSYVNQFWRVDEVDVPWRRGE